MFSQKANNYTQHAINNKEYKMGYRYLGYRCCVVAVVWPGNKFQFKTHLLFRSTVAEEQRRSEG